MADKLYTITELSALIGVAESTMRRYANRHSKYLPSQGVGRRRRYLANSKMIFTRIADLYSQNLTYDQVAEFLDQEYPINIDVQGLTVTQPPQSNELMNVFKDMAGKIKSLELAIYDKDQQIDDLREQISKNHQTTTELITGMNEKLTRSNEIIFDIATRVKATDEALAAWRETASSKDTQGKRPWWMFWKKDSE